MEQGHPDGAAKTVKMGDEQLGQLIREYARECVRNCRAYDAAFEARKHELEREGWRLVDGGQIGSYRDDGTCKWRVTDHRTGAVLAEGSDGPDGYDEAVERLDGECVAAGGQGLYHIDHIDMDDAVRTRISVSPLPGGLPTSLAEAISQWAEGAVVQGDTESLAVIGAD